MMRQLKHRDRECRFSGCGSRRYLQAHHIRHWDQGGPTELDNLILVCFFHHKLVHEHGWKVQRETDGTTSWFQPDGTSYRAGPAPPSERTDRQEFASQRSTLTMSERAVRIRG
jgi:hypothetical protein